MAALVGAAALVVWEVATAAATVVAAVVWVATIDSSMCPMSVTSLSLVVTVVKLTDSPAALYRRLARPEGSVQTSR